MPQDEKAASEMTPAEAEELNSDIVYPPKYPGSTEVKSGAGADHDQNDSKDHGAGNREAPRKFSEKANDDKGKAN